MPALVIPIQHLDSVGKDFVFVLDEAWLKGAFANSDVRGDTSRPGSVEIHAQRNGNEILVHGRAHGWLLAECGRCLKDVSVEVGCELAALYAPQAGSTKRQPLSGAKRLEHSEDEDLELDPEAPDREFYTGDQLAIDDLVRDYLLLELPMQPRCEPECVRLKPSRLSDGLDSGKKTLGLDIDPRLMPLMKLAKGEPEKE